MKRNQGKSKERGRNRPDVPGDRIARTDLLRQAKARQVAEEESVLKGVLGDSSTFLSIEGITRMRERLRVDTPRVAAPEIRRRDVRIVDRGPSGHRVDEPPPWPAVPRILEMLFACLHRLNDRGTCPLLMAAVVHHGVVAVHPFLNGNGRTARVLASAVAGRGPESCRVHVSRSFGGDPESYYRLVGRTLYCPEAFDTWLEFITHGTAMGKRLGGRDCRGAGACGYRFDFDGVLKDYRSFLLRMKDLSNEFSSGTDRRS